MGLHKSPQRRISHRRMHGTICLLTGYKYKVGASRDSNSDKSNPNKSYLELVGDKSTVISLNKKQITGLRPTLTHAKNTQTHSFPLSHRPF